MLNTDQTIQAPTTNTIGLMATPAPPCPAEAGRKTRIDFDKVTAAVHEAMRKTLPHKYTPALADAIAADMAAQLSGAAPTPCPDGIAWCDGDPVNHTNDDDHRHTGPEYKLNGSYVEGGWTDGLMGFQLAQWPDGQPHIVFQSSGAWPDLTMGQVDELIDDATGWLTQLIATRRRLAIELMPSKAPFTEPAEKQTTSAAFDLATRAMDVALANTADRAGTLRALRTFLDMAEAEQA